MTIQLFDQQLFDDLIAKARTAPRKRVNHNVHTDLNEPVQRLFIAIEPGSYVAPHRHPEPEKWEFFMAVRGRLAAFIFAADGAILQRHELKAGEGMAALEIPFDTWHCVIALETGSVFFEVKQGPYLPLSDKGFALWAPREGDAECEAFSQWLVSAQVGDQPPKR